MDGDFEKLVRHKQYSTILFNFLKLRLRESIGEKDIQQCMDDVETGKLTSASVLDKLRSLSSEREKKMSEEDVKTWNISRGAARVREMRAFDGVFDKKNITRYLDIGCGNGAITEAIGINILGLKKEQIIGTDIETWAGHTHIKETSDKITFKPMVGKSKLPVESNSVNVVTIFMMMHHVNEEDLLELMQEIYRVATDNAVIILRDHDSPNNMVDSLINIEHGIFEVIIEKLTTGAEFQKNYYGKYKSKRDWIMNFDQCGFDTFGQSININRPTRPFYQVFKKNHKKPIGTKTIPELRTTARQLGIKLKGNFDTEGIKRAIISGRR